MAKQKATDVKTITLRINNNDQSVKVASGKLKSVRNGRLITGIYDSNGYIVGDCKNGFFMSQSDASRGETPQSSIQELREGKRVISNNPASQDICDIFKLQLEKDYPEFYKESL